MEDEDGISLSRIPLSNNASKATMTYSLDCDPSAKELMRTVGSRCHPWDPLRSVIDPLCATEDRGRIIVYGDSTHS